ncbi:MAG: type II secretion system F family protein [Verrucomicrobia bacterium]|nr:type II secretion system F family protein [Verrucomicrobiota bacterium]
MPIIPSPRYFKVRADFYHQLGQLLYNGIPPAKAFKTLVKSGTSSFHKPSLLAKAQAIENGYTLGEAIFHGPWPVADSLDRNLIDTGEKSGRLVEVLGFVDRYYATIGKVYGSALGRLAYPVVCVHIMALATAAVYWFYNKFDTSGAIRQLLLTLIPFYGILFAGLYFIFNQKLAWVRFWVEKFLFPVPVIGSAMKSMAVSRFSMTFSSMLAAGAGVEQSLKMSAQSSGSILLARSMNSVIHRLRDGLTISSVLRLCRFFSEDYLVAIEVAEESGTIDDALEKLYQQSLEKAENQLQQFGVWFVRIIYAIIAIFMIVQIFAFAGSYGASISNIIDDI